MTITHEQFEIIIRTLAGRLGVKPGSVLALMGREDSEEVVAALSEVTDRCLDRHVKRIAPKAVQRKFRDDVY